MKNIFENWTLGPDTQIPSNSYTTDTLNSTVKLRFQEDNEKAYPPLSIYTALKNTVNAKPDHIMIVTIKSNDETDKLTYQQCWDFSISATKSCIKMGIDQITCVSINAPNTSKWIISEFVVLFSGGVVTGYNLTNSVESIEYGLNDTNCRIIFR